MRPYRPRERGGRDVHYYCNGASGVYQSKLRPYHRRGWDGRFVYSGGYYGNYQSRLRSSRRRGFAVRRIRNWAGTEGKSSPNSKPTTPERECPNR